MDRERALQTADMEDLFGDVISRYSKVAMIRDRDTGRLYLNCRCGTRPTTPAATDPGAVVACVCGQSYTATGWLLAPKDS